MNMLSTKKFNEEDSNSNNLSKKHTQKKIKKFECKYLAIYEVKVSKIPFPHYQTSLMQNDIIIYTK